MKKYLAFALSFAFCMAGALTQACAQSTAPGWDKLVADAKKEGKVVIIAPSDPQVREAIPAAFKARYGITVEYLGGRSSDMASRLYCERAPGIFPFVVARPASTASGSLW